MISRFSSVLLTRTMTTNQARGNKRTIGTSSLLTSIALLQMFIAPTAVPMEGDTKQGSGFSPAFSVPFCIEEGSSIVNLKFLIDSMLESGA